MRITVTLKPARPSGTRASFPNVCFRDADEEVIAFTEPDGKLRQVEWYRIESVALLPTSSIGATITQYEPDLHRWVGLTYDLPIRPCGPAEQRSWPTRDYGDLTDTFNEDPGFGPWD